MGWRGVCLCGSDMTTIHFAATVPLASLPRCGHVSSHQRGVNISLLTSLAHTDKGWHVTT